MDKFLIIGLGNPSSEYDNTRHQIGFMVLDAFVNRYNLKFEKSALNGEVAQFLNNNKKVFLAKPTTYMNLSGEFVAKFIHYYQIPIENVLVIFDDIALPFGTYRLRREGSAGGHNGIKNIIKMLGTEKFKRLKIGIRNDQYKKHNIPMADFVLSKFNKNELNVLNNEYFTFIKIIADFINLDFEKLLQIYNKS